MSIVSSGSLEFAKTIQTMMTEMNKFNSNYPQLWKPEYDDILIELSNIQSIIEDNSIEANNMYKQLPISKYDTFQAYVYNNDINALNVIRGSNERTKILRAKRKNKLCPQCGYQLIFNDTGGTCPNCNYMTSSKSTTVSTRQTSNNNKHIFKQLDALTGTHKAPQNITKIIDYIIIWLTDLRYIYNWLKGIDERRYIQWVKKYEQITDEKITDMFFNKIVEQIPERMWEYNVFKLFTDELYAMLEHATRLSNENVSNMSALNDEQIIKIFSSYVEKFHRLPAPDETFKYENHVYEIGTFISELSLLYQTPKDHIKSKLENLINYNLTLPGLMFNYKQVYKKSENPPKKYCYQQEYCWIINRTFHTQFIDMSNQDKNAIADIIIKFNEYYKEQTFSIADKSCNSPLYCCTIGCVLNLPYFKKYAQALKFVPVKDKGTTNHIKKQFFNFEISHQELLAPYMTSEDGIMAEKIIPNILYNEEEQDYEKTDTTFNINDDVLF